MALTRRNERQRDATQRSAMQPTITRIGATKSREMDNKVR